MTILGYPERLFSLSVDNAGDYLASHGFGGSRDIVALGGGVSNIVIAAATVHGRVVAKQALEKLRVEADWRSRPDRALREALALQEVAKILPPGRVPEVLLVDSENCIYAMRSAPPDSRDWKTLLLRGEVDPRVAAQAGEILGQIVHNTWLRPEWRARFGDQTVFDELRLDPYFRFTASRFPEFAAHLEKLIADCRDRAVALVHGDWSPKNLLVHGEQVTAIDFEVVHFGNPSFDTGFLINHLLLKSIHRPELAGAYEVCASEFWRAYDPRESWLWDATMAQLGGLLLARVAGKSPAEYLTGPQKVVAWRCAQAIVKTPPGSIREVWQCLC
ncbi:MAG: hypothetical protein FJW32_11605 [Acidobacteria bacterium]|nr:hypothetical protein [Acidobacteriota bacterium]